MIDCCINKHSKKCIRQTDKKIFKLPRKYTFQKCKSKNIICVVNKESHELVQLLKSKKVDVAYQKNINGTAGAAESALSLLKTKNSPVLILCGDAPFISSKSIRTITKKLNGHDACVGTVELDIPRGYGRIIRSKNKSIFWLVDLILVRQIGISSVMAIGILMQWIFDEYGIGVPHYLFEPLVIVGIIYAILSCLAVIYGFRMFVKSNLIEKNHNSIKNKFENRL